MTPRIATPLGDIYPFPVCVVLGVLSILLVLHLSLKRCPQRSDEEYFIIPKIFICGIAALGSAALLDAVFKFLEHGTFEFKGITFYGGLIGAMCCMYLLLLLFGKKTQFSIPEWYDILTEPVIVFHIFGRLGCFLAGCCYGRPTDSILGVVFPDLPEYGIWHKGVACHPTQLYEIGVLIVIGVLVLFCKRKFQIYLCLYAISRFFLEYLRGDDRGYMSKHLSPAQGISLLILAAVLLYHVNKKRLHKRKRKS